MSVQYIYDVEDVKDGVRYWCFVEHIRVSTKLGYLIVVYHINITYLDIMMMCIVVIVVIVLSLHAEVLVQS